MTRPVEFSLTQQLSRGLFAIRKNMDSLEKYSLILPPHKDFGIRNLKICAISTHGWNLIFHTEFTFSIQVFICDEIQKGWITTVPVNPQHQSISA
jgi:hypothetical protein